MEIGLRAKETLCFFAARALATGSILAYAYRDDVDDAEMWRTRTFLDQQCITHRKNGWTFNRCEAEQERAAEIAQKELSEYLDGCQAALDGNGGLKAIEAACESGVQ